MIKELKAQTKQLLYEYKRIKINSNLFFLVDRNVHDGLCYATEMHGHALLYNTLKTYLESYGIYEFQYMWPTISRKKSHLSKSDYKKCILPRIEWLQNVIAVCDYLLDNDKTKYELI